MGVTELTFTCFDCCQTYRGPIEHGGPDGCEDSAYARITGVKRESAGRGPICPKCLALWSRQLSKDHFSLCLAAAKKREERENKTVRIYSQHLHGKDGQAQGVWISSDGTFQEIPRTAKSNRPRPDGWRRI